MILEYTPRSRGLPVGSKRATLKLRFLDPADKPRDVDTVQELHATDYELELVETPRESRYFLGRYT